MVLRLAYRNPVATPPDLSTGIAWEDCYFPRTTSIPANRSSSLARGSFPTRSVRRFRSTVTIRETFATESFGSPVSRAESETFPGAFAQRRLLVNGTHTTVAIRLRFSASPCTTTTGLLNPGRDPVAAGRSAHQISPCEITTRFALKCAGRPMRRTHLSHSPTRCKPDPWHPLHLLERAAPRTP